MDSKSVRNLLQVMSELTLPQRRDFLQFVTGSPKLPIGGKSHDPLTTIQSLPIACRIQEPEPHVYGGVQACRGSLYLGRLLDFSYDMCELRQASRLFEHRRPSKTTTYGHLGRPGSLPPFMIPTHNSYYWSCNFQ